MFKSRRRSSAIPDASKVQNGTYIDFEGFGSNEHRKLPPPVLVGIYRKPLHGDFDAGFQQIVLNEAYRAAAEDSGVAHKVTYVSDRDEFLKELVREARRNAPVFAFSTHELKILQRACGYPLERRYGNVLSIAKRHLRMFEKGVDSDWNLRAICEHLNVPLAGKLKKGGVTDGLREVRGHSSSRRAWQSAPASVRDSWRDVLLHNYADVKAIYEVMRRLVPATSHTEVVAG